MTVHNSYAAETGAGSYAAGEAVTIRAGSRSGYRFSGWTSPDGIAFASRDSAETAFVMPGQAVTVNANWTYLSSSSGGGSSSGGYTPPAPTYPPTVEQHGEGGGSPTVSPSNPKQGDAVTIRPRPDQDYEVDAVTVTGPDGKPVEVAAKPDGTYTFIQPAGRATVEVSYQAVQPAEILWRNPFADVPEGAWYYEAVRFVQENDLMNGYSDGAFAPNTQFSQAQLAQILFNKKGRPTENYLAAFSGVAEDEWCAEATRWAASQGIAGGCGNGMFGPNDPIPREQLAVMLWRCSGSPAATGKELHFAGADAEKLH